jgi:hypothetical protein
LIQLLISSRKTCQNSCVDAAGYSNARNKQVVFLFYNPTTVAFGKLEKIWGDRSPKVTGE